MEESEKERDRGRERGEREGGRKKVREGEGGREEGRKRERAQMCQYKFNQFTLALFYHSTHQSNYTKEYLQKSKKESVILPWMGTFVSI